ncbi:MAG: glycosyltransferase [Tetrasphaera sp.]|nr:glycosyltransferase [Tetrasphaera sp.]
MTSSMRVGVISMHTSPVDSPGSGDAGGMNVVESSQARALADRGHTVDLVTRRSSPEQPDFIDLGGGVRLHILDAGPPARLAKSEIDQHIGQFREGLARLAREQQWCLIHSHHWMSGVAALPVARDLGIPHVQSFHSVAADIGQPLSDGEPPESPDRVPGERLVARESDAVVAISAAEARTVVERCEALPESVHIVWPGVDHTLFRPLRTGEPRWTAPGAREWPNGYVLFAARLQPLKGPDLAMRALAHMEKWQRPHLVIAGDAAEDFAGYSSDLDDLVTRLGLEEDVTFVGPQPREDLAVLLRGARLVLVPSHSETFGLIALEAAASGAPVLAASAGGLREAVAHGETGQLMDSREPEDWGRAMTYLLGTDGLLQRMGVVAGIHARRFEWVYAARRMEDLYCELLGRPGNPLAGAQRVVVVHAHPDDETLSTGVLLASLVRSGVEVHVVTATRGERGGLVDGVQAPEPGTEAYAVHRESELAGALAALGVDHHAFLGSGAARAEGREPRVYRDSGMRWVTPTVAGPADDAAPGSLVTAGVAETAADVTAYLTAVRADAVVSYDATGGYGHPDHVRLHEVTVAAAADAGVPFVEVVPPNTAGRDIAWLDLREELPRVIAALAHHRTQLTVDGSDVVHQGGQREAIVTRIGLRLLG